MALLELVDICKESGHVANEYCALVEGNETYEVGLLDLVRAFPVRGIVVLDQAYVLSSVQVPAGYYPAVSPDVDAISVECYIHDEDDLPEDEEEDKQMSDWISDLLGGRDQSGSENDGWSDHSGMDTANP